MSRHGFHFFGNLLLEGGRRCHCRGPAPPIPGIGSSTVRFGSLSLFPRIQLSRSVTIWARNSSLASFVTPIAERALGELHDVALVHQGHKRLEAYYRWHTARREACQALGSSNRDGLDPHARMLAHLLLAAVSAYSWFRNSISRAGLWRTLAPTRCRRKHLPYFHG